jgi:nitroimidazol reductase NimA-like FMN-containing flavoprotein (pyridoxamine 5'-phosphate oxidase superfamily)
MFEDVQGGELSRAQIDHLLAGPVLARLATATGTGPRPHLVPLWFLWDGTAIWMSSFRSTRKIHDLMKNPGCSVLVDQAESGVDFWAVLFEGEAELLAEPRALVEEMSTRIYARYLGQEGAQDPRPQSWIHDPENLLIMLAPRRTRTWYSARSGSALAATLARHA